ncbi:hypothetical protein PDK35_02450 [Bacillus cereus group sp. TH153LC]|uniref:hypothetical protein n=1 Tax=Bacillus cereus group sp. TH153LC TaxID=3018059 RepID=UPI0022E3AF7D|nr:hypothetical protein [Bacillus cereus group sp. TH153LC]MDA1658836.1 hypothetical protein [Bacillus cereus group sp. TH153LC]
MKTIKRDLYAKKPQGDGNVLFPRERSLTALIRRCQLLEESHNYVEPIFKVLPVLPSGEIVYDRIYYECHMVSKIENPVEWYQKNKKKILMLNLDGEVLREFDSLRDASTFLISEDITSSLSISGTAFNMTTAARKGKPYLGYRWKYASEGDLL